MFKKKDDLSKKNYRPVSVLSHVSKIFKGIVFNQLNHFLESTFSLLLTGFHKNHSKQDAPLNMNEKRKLDKEEKVGTIFTDLSEALDTLNHNLLLTKLRAYGFCFSGIKMFKAIFRNNFKG